MRRFVLRRDEDVTGVSGTGYVAEGVEFWDKSCCMKWRTKVNSTTVYASLDDLNEIHSHEGRTTIVWIDEDNSDIEITKEINERNGFKVDG